MYNTMYFITMMIFISSVVQSIRIYVHDPLIITISLALQLVFARKKAPIQIHSVQGIKRFDNRIIKTLSVFLDDNLFKFHVPIQHSSKLALHTLENL